ncbi:23S rRNA (pseudouridine(1915)-N(3))-methyltransferase RlmH [Staphylococcus haemolyticus]|uniref:23S rRNA (pseudouridine(1915)-N(3))-methyltransferase RlmH n=1 Tax=Staphylococcus haemolyticus TaxID=1283 RepID=UPI0030CEC006
MKITILAVGKLKEKYWKQAISEYEKRLGAYSKIEIIEVPDEKAPENMSVLQRSNYALSFSKMTFPHQMMRVVLIEQVYRAFKIMRGEAYHK